MATYKVVNTEQLDVDLTVVADAIRSKSGTTESLEFPNGMKTAIENILPDFSTGYNDNTHSLWGVWRINDPFQWAMDSGNYYIEFTFYGYVDGVYQDGVSAMFYDTISGPVQLMINGSTVWENYNGSITSKLTDGIVGFGLTPQTFTDTYFYNSFKSNATKIF